jgi:hypothetical protein
MIIPIEVVYTTIGRKKYRNVIAAIYPTILAQIISKRSLEPIIVELGDKVVDWESTSPGYLYYEAGET